MSFYTRTHQALHEADDERLRRAAAAGDLAAQEELRRRQFRQGTVDWDEVSRRWSTVPPRDYRPARNGLGEAFFCRILHEYKELDGTPIENLDLAVENSLYGPLRFVWTRHFTRWDPEDDWSLEYLRGSPTVYGETKSWDEVDLPLANPTPWAAIKSQYRQYTDTQIYQALKILMPMDKWRHQEDLG